MKTSYQTLKNFQPKMEECFFAFSDQQFAEGLKEKGIEGKKIFRGFGGLYGTQEGLRKFYNGLNDNSKRISEECDPQEVYDYEFNNHECEYIGDDIEAIKLVVSYFGEEKAKLIKRIYGYTNIEDLDFSMYYIK